MWRRLALSVLAVVALAAPSARAAAPVQHRVAWRFTYDGTGSATMLLSGRVVAGPGGGLLATVFGAQDGGGALADVLDFGSNDQPGTYGKALTTHPCPPPVTCRVVTYGNATQFSMQAGVIGDGEHVAHVEFDVLLGGSSVRINRPAMLGWKQRRVSTFAQGTDHQAATAGVDANVYEAEAIDDLTWPGGRAGSLAVAVPPCDVTGAGLTQLSGGSSGTVTTACPSRPIVAVARGATTWHLSATVAGVSQLHTRLLVVSR